MKSKKLTSFIITTLISSFYIYSTSYAYGNLNSSLGGLGTLPSMPTLNSGIVEPNGLYPVGETVNFKFNPLFRIIKDITLLDVSGKTVKRLFTDKSGIDISRQGFCYRFKERGLITLEVTATDIFGKDKISKTSFQISEYGPEGKYCAPFYTGRIYSLANPEYVPEFEDQDAKSPRDTWDSSYAGGNGLELSWRGKVWKESWSNTLDQAISKYAFDLLDNKFIPKHEVTTLCPNYLILEDLEKRRFWITFMAAIAYAESGYNTEAKFMEPAPLNKNSVGLFQLSYDDTRHGSGCYIKNEESLTDPTVNIKCAIKIMRNQIEERNTLWPKRFYYWSVLTTSKKHEVKGVFKAYKDNFLEFCN